MYEAEIGFRVFVRWWRREDLEIGIRKLASLLPEVDATFSARAEDKRSLLWTALT